jgi:hypothetical protein
MNEVMTERQDTIWQQLTTDLLNSKSLEHAEKSKEIQLLGLYAWALYCDLKANGTVIVFPETMLDNRRTDSNWPNDSPDDVGFFMNYHAIEALINGITNQATLRPNSEVIHVDEMNADEFQRTIYGVEQRDIIDADDFKST